MNDIYVGALFSDSYLEHHGILGMKWGVRRFRNKDGSLTTAGKKRKISNENKREETRKAVRDYSKKYNKASKASDDADELWRDAKGAYKNTGKNALSRVANNIKYDPDREEKGNTKTKDKNAKSNGKKLAIAAAAAVGVGLAAYGAYKLHDSRTPKLVNTGESKTKELFGATFKRSSNPDRARMEKRAYDALSDNADAIVKAFRSGKIDRREYTKYINAIDKANNSYVKPFKTFEPTRIDIPRTSIPRTDVPRTNISRTEVERTEIPRVSFKDMTIDDLKKMDLW